MGGGRLRSAYQALRGGSASASLKFDIPGLQQFRREIDQIRDALNKLKTSFDALSRAPKGFADQLKLVNEQLVAMKKNMPAGGAGGFGTSPNFISTGQAQPGQARPAGWVKTVMSATATGTGAGGAATNVANQMMAAGASPGLAIAGGAAAGIGGMIGQGITAMGNRFDQGASVAAQMDVFGSRTALYTGVNASKAYKQLGASGQPFFGTAVDVQQEIYRQGTMGNVLGGTGVVGQRGQQAAANIQGLQYLMPGMSAQQAGGIQAGMQANVAGMRMGAAVFGQAASMYKAGGGLKSMPEYFKGILSVIMKNRTGNKAGQPYSKEELEALRIPGSNMYSWLAQMQWDPDTINAFFDWAIGQASTDSTMKQLFQPTEASMKKIRGGSLATDVQKTQETQATRDTQFAGQQYKAMESQQKRDQQLIDVLTKLDNTLNKFYGVFGQFPTGSGGALGNIASSFLTKGPLALASLAGMIPGVGGALKSLPVVGGLFGDPGPETSGLNPDLRRRIDAMQAANPALRVVSGLRTSMQQKRLWESGRGGIAPPGKSQHTRGNAADLGPASQYGWIAANARKFGLDHAGGMGEPWHVQVGGTISGIGDPQGDLSPGEKFVAEAMARQSSFARNAFAQLIQNSAATSSAGGGTGAASAPAADATQAPSSAPTSGIVDVKTVVQAAYAAGFRGDDLVNFSAIPARETHYKTDSHNLNPNTGDDSWGLWQINVRKDANYSTVKDMLGGEDWSQLYNPYTAAQVAYKMYQLSGNTLRPWGGYKGQSNTYDVPDQAFQDAKSAAQSLGYLGDPIPAVGGGGPNGYTSGAGSLNVSHTPVTFNNTFHIVAQPGTDTEALARNLASKLDAQYQRAQGLRR
jgi:hypothetical protein